MTNLDRSTLLFGAAAAAVFTLNFLVLGALLPGYNATSQTISELGEAGARFEFALGALTMTAMICLCVFAIGLFRFSSSHRLSHIPVAVLAVYPLCGIGVSIFPSPHPLHNVFGISSMFGMLSPLAMAVTWKVNPPHRLLPSISMVAALLLLIEIGLNLSPLFVEFGEADYVRTHYGAIQRSMYLTFYGWLGYLAVTLFSQSAAERPATA